MSQTRETAYFTDIELSVPVNLSESTPPNESTPLVTLSDVVGSKEMPISSAVSRC